MKTGYSHPAKTCVPLSVGVTWGEDGSIYQEKMDGYFHVHPVDGGVLVGEMMRGGDFYAFDCVEFEGVDVRTHSLSSRLNYRDSLAVQHGILTVRTDTDGVRLLIDVLANGGEGVVRKQPNSNYFTAMEACKRSWIWHCRVRAVSPMAQSVEIECADSGADLGRVPMRAGKADQVRKGSLIRVEGLCLTKNGKIREPRLCREWLTAF